MPACSHPADAMQSGPSECSRPFHKRLPRFHRTSEAGIFTANFSFSFATHRSPCCYDDSPWPLSDMPCIAISGGGGSHSNLQVPRVCSVSLWLVLLQMTWFYIPFSTSPIQGYKMLLKQLFHSYIQSLLQGSLLPWQPDYPPGGCLREQHWVWWLGRLFGASPA